MESLEQPAQLRTLLETIQQKDSYNKFCVDCNKNESTHASVTFGVLICQECAQTHMTELGMDISYIKSLFNELWDDYQVKCVKEGGNKKFWDFMKQYNLEWKPIDSKYQGKVAKYYKRRLSAEVQNKEFTEEQPARNVEEVLQKSASTVKDAGAKAGQGIMKFGAFLGDKINQSGVKDKFTGLFNKKGDQQE